MPLSELAIRALKPKGKPYRVVDSGNLFLEVSTAGGKLWRWRYVFAGKAQLLSLGKYPTLSLSEARKERDKARELVKAGRHPTREKKLAKLRAEVASSNTFEQNARLWLSRKQAGLNEKYHKQCLARMEQHVFPMIGGLPISEITIPDVVKVVEKISERGTIETAKRMKQLIAQVFRYAAQRGLCLHNPASDLRDLLPSREEKHHGCIHPDELQELLKAMDNYRGNPLTHAAIQLLALTFVRTSELIEARWDEINFDKAEWHIPKERMKMRRPHVVPLSKQALRILKSLHKLTGTKDFIFHSPQSRTKHLSNGAILMALRRMGYKNRMTGHGFRTLASTILNEKGYNRDWIERQLAHEDEDRIRSAYNRAEYLPERTKMMQHYATLLDTVRASDCNRTTRVLKEAI